MTRTFIMSKELATLNFKIFFIDESFQLIYWEFCEICPNVILNYFYTISSFWCIVLCNFIRHELECRDHSILCIAMFFLFFLLSDVLYIVISCHGVGIYSWDHSILSIAMFLSIFWHFLFLFSIGQWST